MNNDDDDSDDYDENNYYDCAHYGIVFMFTFKYKGINELYFTFWSVGTERPNAVALCPFDEDSPLLYDLFRTTSY